MSDNQEQFDLTSPNEEPINPFKIVHVYNQSDKYHLTRQVLLDSSLTQNTYCFFYHILSKDIDEFNKIYGSFACLIARNLIEADLYLNVDVEALHHIIKYIQTSKMSAEDIYSYNWKTIDEIIDLATMFGMPILVSNLRNLHPNDQEIERELENIKYSFCDTIKLYRSYYDIGYSLEECEGYIDTFVRDNRQELIDTYIKPQRYSNSSFSNDLWELIIKLLVAPFLAHFSKKDVSQSSQDNSTISLENSMDDITSLDTEESENDENTLLEPRPQFPLDASVKDLLSKSPIEFNRQKTRSLRSSPNSMGSDLTDIIKKNLLEDPSNFIGKITAKTINDLFGKLDQVIEDDISESDEDDSDDETEDDTEDDSEGMTESNETMINTADDKKNN